MNVLDKLSILSAMLNCQTCGNCVAKDHCSQIRKGEYIIEIIHDVRELLKEESHAENN
jgi:hypothetical protein